MKNNFTSIESLENWLTWQYLSKLGKTHKEIAYLMDVNEQKLIEWVNNRSAKMNQLVKAQSGKVEVIMKSLQRKYRPPKSDEPEIPKVDVKKVVKLMADQDRYTLDEIAKKLHFKPENFRRWFNAIGTRQKIDAAIRKL